MQWWQGALGSSHCMAGRLLPACQGTDEQVLLGLHQGYCLATGLAMCVRNGAALQDRSLKGGWLVGWVGE